MDMYFIYSNGNDINCFRGKNKFMKETIKTLKECVALYGREFDSEAKLLGFNLTPYEDEDDDCLGGGEIILDNDCYTACIKFWESYGTPTCKVVIKKGEE